MTQQGEKNHTLTSICKQEKAKNFISRAKNNITPQQLGSLQSRHNVNRSGQDKVVLGSKSRIVARRSQGILRVFLSGRSPVSWVHVILGPASNQPMMVDGIKTQIAKSRCPTCPSLPPISSSHTSLKRSSPGSYKPIFPPRCTSRQF